MPRFAALAQVLRLNAGDEGPLKQQWLASDAAD
jgi:hypothetical protein